MDKSRTYGEFITSMKETKITSARIFIEEWEALATEEQWEQLRPMPLTKQMVLSFAENMARRFWRMIADGCTDDYIHLLTEEGHAFLREIHARAVEFGIAVEVREIDRPLRPSELCAALGAVQVIASGE